MQFEYIGFMGFVLDGLSFRFKVPVDVLFLLDKLGAQCCSRYIHPHVGYSPESLLHVVQPSSGSSKPQESFQGWSLLAKYKTTTMTIVSGKAAGCKYMQAVEVSNGRKRQYEETGT